MKREALRVVVVGVGRVGLIHAKNFKSHVPAVELVALVDTDEKAVKQSGQQLDVGAVFSDYREALASVPIDAVVIAAPTHTHSPIALEVARQGKHIFCEKPMALNLQECDAMNAAAAAAGVILQMGFMRRFSPSFLAAKARIEDGLIGKVVQVKSQTHGPSEPRRWMFDIKESNGPLAEVNSHDIDTIRWFSGSEFNEVFALASNYRTAAAKEEFPDFYDQVLLIAGMTNGSQGCVSGAQGVHYGYDARCEVIGTEGLVTIGSLSGSDVVVCTKKKELISPSMDSWANLFRDAYLAEDIDFIESIQGQRAPRASGVDGRAAVAVVEAGNQSIRQRRPVSVQGGRK
jgi:predicted dehydrogenase